ncbi:MAG: hypothetical protein V3R93_08260 [Candidatus Hydrothermarchaeaceae archaeon]
MEMRTAFIIGIAVLLFTLYYLERAMEKRHIFWLYAAIGIALGSISVYTVAKQQPNFDYYITFAVLSVLIAILYYDEPEEEGETKHPGEKKKKKRKGK